MLPQETSKTCYIYIILGWREQSFRGLQQMTNTEFIKCPSFDTKLQLLHDRIKKIHYKHDL